MALEKELETYKRKLPELLADEGKFVLIHGNDIIDVYGTYEDAIKEGYTRFKLTPFLVKQIQSIEQVQFITEPMQDASRGAPLDFSNVKPTIPQMKPKKLDQAKLAELRERLQRRASNLHLSRDPSKVSYGGRDADAAWNDEFKNSTLPSETKFKLSD